MYVVIGVVLIILVVLGAFIVVGNRQRQSQIDAAYQILTEIGQDTQALTSSWNKAKSEIETLGIVEITDDLSELNAAIVYSTDKRALLSDIKTELDSVSVYQSKIDASLQALQKLELPSWVNDYAGLMKSMLEKDRERLQKAQQLLDSADRYYAFSEPLAQGMLAQISMEQHLNDGSNKFEGKDYVGAREHFSQALDQNSQVDKYASDARKIIAMTYLDKIHANKVEAQAVINKYLGVLALADAGSYGEADRQYQEAEKAYESLLAKRLHSADLMPENKAWWDGQVASLQNELKQLTAAIEDLQQQAEALIEKNKR